MGVSEEGTFLNLMLKKVRQKIMKLLLFEDCDSNSLHLLLSRSVFSAPDRLREKIYIKEIPLHEHRAQIGRQ